MRTVLFLLVSALLVPCAWTQSLPQGQNETAYLMVNDSLVGGLVLDTMQRRQLVAVEQRYQQGYDAVLTNDTLGDAAMRIHFQELTVRRDAEIRHVMSPAQFAEWQSITANDQGDLEAP